MLHPIGPSIPLAQIPGAQPRRSTGAARPVTVADPAPPSSRNALLAALPPSERAQLLPHLGRVTLRAEETIVEAGATLRQVHFPETAVAVMQLDRGAGAGLRTVATVGAEGVVGVEAVLGQTRAHLSAIARIPGEATTLPVDVLRAALTTLPGLRPLLDGYLLSLLLETARVTQCARTHGLQRRLATLLLRMEERVGADQFRITHGSLSEMLGVRRAGVTEAAARLRDLGAIGYGRRSVIVRDRAQLVAESCDCHRLLDEPMRRGGADVGDVR